MYEKTTLPNGLRIITGEMPHTRSAAVQYYIRSGARDEVPERSGISHFLEHMVFKGTYRRPNPVEISEAIEGVGGGLDASTDHEHTNYRALVPSGRLDVALDVLTDMVRCAQLLTSDIKKEREVIIEEINSTFDSPTEIADLLFNELMWGDHPLGKDVAGTRQSVRRLKREDLQEHLKTFYLPSATVLSVAGNVEHNQVVSIVERLWDGVGSTLPRSIDEQAPPEVQPGPRIRHYRKDTEQSNLIVGVPALPYTHPMRYAQEVLDALLGAGMSSRLFVSVREERGLAYSVSSFLRTYADVGAFAVHAAVDNERVGATLEAIMGELKRIAQERAGEAELRKVKEFIKGHTLLGLERSGYVAQWAGWQELMLGRIESVDETLEEIESVTADQILDLAQLLFSTNNLHLALVGPGRAPSRLRETLTLD